MQHKSRKIEKKVLCKTFKRFTKMETQRFSILDKNSVVGRNYKGLYPFTSHVKRANYGGSDDVGSYSEF